jgi:hypothetical protein
MPNIRPAQATLNELRDGQVMVELAQGIHDAIGAAQYHRKEAKVVLTITFAPMGTQGVSNAVEVIGCVDTKLPKIAPPSTLMFLDLEGNPSRQQDRQTEIPFSIAAKSA